MVKRSKENNSIESVECRQQIPRHCTTAVVVGSRDKTDEDVINSRTVFGDDRVVIDRDVFVSVSNRLDE